MTGQAPASTLHAFLRGDGTDGRGRTLAQVIALDDAELERLHDYIQWLFPLPTPSMAVPGSPVLTQADREAVSRDAAALANLQAATARMRRFYGDSPHWLVPYDHNHLRITRIITSLGLLAGGAAARAFHDFVDERSLDAAINAESRRRWREAARASVR